MTDMTTSLPKFEFAFPLTRFKRVAEYIRRTAVVWAPTHWPRRPSALTDLSPHLRRDINAQSWANPHLAHLREVERYEAIKATLPWRAPL